MFETVGRTQDPDYWLRQVVSGCLTLLLVAGTITTVVLWWLAKLLWPILRALLEALWLALFGTQLPPMIDAWFVEVPVVAEVVEEDPGAGDIGVLVEIIDEEPGEADLAEMLAPEPEPEPAFERMAALDLAIAESAGLLAVLSSSSFDEMDSVFAAGLDDELVMGAMIGYVDGEAFGSSGLSGLGSGGGGTGEGTIGLGSIGTIGHGGGGGTGSGYGSGTGRISSLGSRDLDDGEGGIAGGVIGGVEGGVIGGTVADTSPPTWVKRVSPDNAGLAEGRCTARVRVDDRGRFESLSWRSCPSELREMTRDALERSRWKPGTEAGQPVSATIDVVFDYVVE